MSKLKIKNNEKQDEEIIEETAPDTSLETTTSTPEPEATTDYGVGGVYRSIGGGKRVKI